jgi:hypothetical protein
MVLLELTLRLSEDFKHVCKYFVHLFPCLVLLLFIPQTKYCTPVHFTDKINKDFIPNSFLFLMTYLWVKSLIDTSKSNFLIFYSTLAHFYLTHLADFLSFLSRIKHQYTCAITTKYIELRTEASIHTALFFKTIHHTVKLIFLAIKSWHVQLDL